MRKGSKSCEHVDGNSSVGSGTGGTGYTKALGQNSTNQLSLTCGQSVGGQGVLGEGSQGMGCDVHNNYEQVRASHEFSPCAFHRKPAANPPITPPRTATIVATGLFGSFLVSTVRASGKEAT